MLTTFITLYGHYCFKKLSFGLSNAPEHFQKHMSQILIGLEGVLCQTDNVLVFGRNQEQHDARLAAALERIRASGATLTQPREA